jgi:hypothetical protein
VEEETRTTQTMYPLLSAQAPWAMSEVARSNGSWGEQDTLKVGEEGIKPGPGWQIHIYRFHLAQTPTSKPILGRSSPDRDSPPASAPSANLVSSGRLTVYYVPARALETVTARFDRIPMRRIQTGEQGWQRRQQIAAERRSRLLLNDAKVSESALRFMEEQIAILDRKIRAEGSKMPPNRLKQLRQQRERLLRQRDQLMAEITLRRSQRARGK